MAAIVMPLFGEQVQLAKEAAAKDNLRVLREVIERYAAENNDVPPGYTSGNPLITPTSTAFRFQIIQKEKYLKDIPENPFNNKNTVLMIVNNGTFPPASGDYGWVYMPQTKTIKIDYPGSDEKGVAYYDY